MHPKSILLDGQALHGSDRFGEWFVTGLEGWNEPPASRSTDSERMGAHGDYVGPATYSARTPTIDGVLFLKDHDQGLQAMNLLNSRLSLQGGTLSVTESGLTQHAHARLVGLDWTWETSEAIRYQLRLKCPDSFKYGGWQEPVTAAQGQSALVFHRGTAASAPMIRVQGSAPGGYTVVHEDGSALDITAPLSGEHVVDCSTSRAYTTAGVPLTDYGRAQSIRIMQGPAQAITVRPITTGTLTATTTVQDVWI